MQKKVSVSKEWYVYAHDNRGLTTGGRIFTAATAEDAIIQGKSFNYSFPIPEICTYWVARCDREALKAGRS